ncbi:MAG: hypothetical protein R3F34_00695 [Planctomycetota bacterium]
MFSQFTWASLALSLAAGPALAGGGSMPNSNGWAAVTCGTRTIYPASEQYTFGLIDVRNPVFGPNHYNAPAFHHPEWVVNNIGNVFGVTWDNDRDIYVTASSNVEGFSTPNAPKDGIWRYGSLGGGANSLAAAGTIYKIDGQTGSASVFAVLPQQQFVMTSTNYASRVTGPGLGNIAYDTNNDQFFVTNMEDGRIYRISNTGQVLSNFDPMGADNGAIGFAPRGERLWGISLLNGRVYYSVWPAANAQPTVRSVALVGGDFAPATDQLEFAATYLNPGHPISDIEFSWDGRMMCAQRTMANFTLLGLTLSDVDTYNHRTSVAVFTGGPGAWSEAKDWGISVLGGNTPESYGGGDWADVTGLNDVVWSSAADMLNTSGGSHGIAGLQFTSLPADPAAAITPICAIKYDPNNTIDAKGIGGDISVIGRTRPPCTGVFVQAAVDTNLPGCNHPTDGVLTGTLPVLGSNWCWNLDSQFPLAAYWLFGSKGPSTNTPIFGTPCTIHIDIFSYFSVTYGFLDGNGSAAGCLALPPATGLVGCKFTLQARLCDPNFGGQKPIPGFPDFFSNGMCLTLGCP